MIDEALRALSGQFGVLAGFIFIVITGAMGKWVFGYIYKDGLADKDKQIAEWKDIALRAMNVGEKVVGTREKDDGQRV